MLRPLLLWCVVVLGMAPAAVTHAQDQDSGEALLVTGESILGRLQLLQDGVLTLETAPESAAREVPLDELVRWGAPAPGAQRQTVYLRDGSMLVAAAAWSRDGVLLLEDAQWVVRHATLAPVHMPRGDVRAVLFQAAYDPAGETARREAMAYSGDEDRVWLASGDALSGRLERVHAGELTFSIAGEEVAIAEAKVVAVALAGEPPSPPKPDLVVGLRDGTLLYTSGATVDGEGLKATLTDGAELIGRRADAVTFLQAFGPRVAYLSDLEPLDYQHTPYFDVSWPLGVDQSLDGGPLQTGGQRRLKGLAMHSAARVVYRLDGDWRRLEAQLAIDDGAGDAEPGGSVVCRVYVAREGSFEQAFESAVIRAGDEPLPVSVDVSGASAVALLVDFADYGDQQDHVDWLDARLVK